MADDTLTPEQVAEIRETEINRRDWDSPASPIPALCDTVEALRESANEAARQCFTAEEILDARIKDLDDLREQLREMTEERDIHKAKTQAYLDTAAENAALREQLREAREGLIQTHEEDQEYTVTFTQELREELAEVREQLREADLSMLKVLAKYGRLTDALREAKEHLTSRPLRLPRTELAFDVIERALAEMGGENGTD